MITFMFVALAISPSQQVGWQAGRSGIVAVICILIHFKSNWRETEDHSTTQKEKVTSLSHLDLSFRKDHTENHISYLIKSQRKSARIETFQLSSTSIRKEKNYQQKRHVRR